MDIDFLSVLNKIKNMIKDIEDDMEDDMDGMALPLYMATKQPYFLMKALDGDDEIEPGDLDEVKEYIQDVRTAITSPQDLKMRLSQLDTRIDEKREKFFKFGLKRMERERQYLDGLVSIFSSKPSQEGKRFVTALDLIYGIVEDCEEGNCSTKQIKRYVKDSTKALQNPAMLEQEIAQIDSEMAGWKGGLKVKVGKKQQAKLESKRTRKAEVLDRLNQDYTH